MKYLQTFEEKVEPKHKYDCKKCKFNWCCGFDTSCHLRLPDAPEDSEYQKYSDMKKAADKYNI